VTDDITSIVIPTYRRPDLLRNLLQSLTSQRTTRRFEVIVVNDGSGGDISELEIEFSDISLKVVNLPTSRGRAFARNEGVRRSRGNAIIFVDDDMTVVEDFVAEHSTALADPDMVVIGNILRAPEFGNDPLARYVERQGINKLRSRRKIPPKCVRTGNVSLSRSLFDRIGMFDERITRYGEDMDLGMKLSTAGARMVFAEKAIAFHHHPPDVDDMMEKMREYGRFTVPHLVAMHPELKRVIRIHLAEPVRIFRESPLLSAQKIALRVILTRPFYATAKAVYRLRWLGALLFPVIDYMRAYNYIKGYWLARKEGLTC